MKDLTVVLKTKNPCTVKIPEVGLQVSFEIIDARIAMIGEGINVLDTILKVVDQKIYDEKPFGRIPLNQLPEEELNKVSKFEYDVPAMARFETESNITIDVYAEPSFVKFSDKYITALGFPHFNITTMSGAIVVQKD